MEGGSEVEGVCVGGVGSVGDLALLYNSRVKGKPKKLHTEWMGPYMVEEIHPNGSVRLKTLQGLVFRKLVNGAQLKR